MTTFSEHDGEITCRGILPIICVGNIDSAVWSYCVRGLGDALHTREFPLVLFSGRALAISFGSVLLPVPDHPWISVVFSTIIIIDHNGLLDLDLHVQFTSRRRLDTVLASVELGPHGVGDVARGGDLVSDHDSAMRTLLSGFCKGGVR